MVEKFMFWAQALDNASPDHIYCHGKLLLPDDGSDRQEVVSFVSAVVRYGKRIFIEDGVRLITHKKKFVIEIPSMEQDVLGRSAPIICSGVLVAEDREFYRSITQGIVDFSHQIGRTILPAHLNLVRKAIYIQKKSAKRLLMLKVGMLFIILILLVSIVHSLSPKIL